MQVPERVRANASRARSAFNRRHELAARGLSKFDRSLLISQPCTYRALQAPEFSRWAEALRPEWDAEGKLADTRVLLHRKLWEWLYITEALASAGMLQPGKRGVGFGVGKEPLTALFASMGATITATDLDDEAATDAGWKDNDEFAGRLEGLNERRICDPVTFASRVTYRSVDMRAVPGDLCGFDFSWSSCAFEHLGTIDAGIDFVLDQLKCVRPGGSSVHTTEFNVSSDTDTVEEGGTVLYRRRDLARLVAALHERGHRVKVDFALGQTPQDEFVDTPPFGKGDAHLKMALGQHVTTSFGLTIRKARR